MKPKIDSRTQKIRERIYIEIERVLTEKNKENPKLENTDSNLHKNY